MRRERERREEKGNKRGGIGSDGKERRRREREEKRGGVGMRMRRKRRD